MTSIYYINCENEKIHLDGTQGIYISSTSNKLRDFSWSVSKKNSKISALSKGVSSKQFDIYIVAGNNNTALRNKFYEVTEKDVLNGIMGKLVVGNYYLRCFVTESSKGTVRYNNSQLKLTIKVTTDQDAWVKETENSFKAITSAEEEYLDYPFEFPYGYKSQLAIGKLNNTWIMPCDFRMILYGNVSNPTVHIGNHEYSLNTDLETGEYAVIDSKNKTITKVATNGAKTNIFNSRSLSSYIFEKIPVGVSSVSFDDSVRFDITLLEERSEPKWT